MNASEPLLETVRWLATNARFPAARLEKRAEVLLCLSALAAAAAAEERQRYLIQTRDPAQISALKTHGLRRARVHFKCDNSAKV